MLYIRFTQAQKLASLLSLQTTPPKSIIIICTRNRAESLRPTLESIGKVTVPRGWTVELLHIYKELSSARLIKLAEFWIGKAGDLRQFKAKTLLREFGSRVLEKVKPAPQATK